jgi:acyl-CoA synthetase (AMP-forming)/AMP-acid ligase II
MRRACRAALPLPAVIPETPGQGTPMLDLTIGRSLRLAAEARPEAVALRFEERTITHGELESWSNRIAHGLRTFGVKKGDRLGVMLHNSPLYVALAAGAAKAGIALVTLNYRFTGAEIAYHLGDAGAVAIVSDRNARPAVRDARALLPRLRSIAAQRDESDETAIEDLIEGQPTHPPDVKVREGDVLVLQYTSGTTGRPKGAIITHRNRSLAFLHWPIAYGFRGDDILMHAGPFHHSAPFGMALCQLCLGGRVVILPSFKPDAAVTAIAREKVSWAFMVPTMLNQICQWLADQRQGPDLSSLRRLLSGASALPTALKERVLECFPSAGLYEFYGATEAGTITVLRPEDQRHKTRCVGRPVFGSEVRIVDDDGQPVPPGTVGEIFLRTPSLFDGYHNAPEKTAAAFREDWCTLGDLGRLDEEGYLYIVDRLKDVIKSGGVNIYPSEIEEVLLTYPDVAEAAVIGVPNEHWGEAVHAVLVTRAARQPDATALVEHCRRHLADYKIPKSFECRPALPHSAAGKILKRELRSEFWTDAVAKV